MRQCVRFSFFLLLASLFAACSANETPRLALTMEPSCVELSPGQSQQFSARVFIDQIDQGLDNQAVSWAVVGGNLNGNISNELADAGLYHAPEGMPAEDVVTIQARSKVDGQKTAQAVVFFVGSCPE